MTSFKNGKDGNKKRKGFEHLKCVFISQKKI